MGGGTQRPWGWAHYLINDALRTGCRYGLRFPPHAWPGSSVSCSVVHSHQGWGLDPRSGHMQASTNECTMVGTTDRCFSLSRINKLKFFLKDYISQNLKPLFLNTSKVCLSVTHKGWATSFLHQKWLFFHCCGSCHFPYVEPKFLQLCLVWFPLHFLCGISLLFTLLDLRLFIALLHLFIHLLKKIYFGVASVPGTTLGTGHCTEGVALPSRSAVLGGLTLLYVLPPLPHHGELLVGADHVFKDIALTFSAHGIQ